MALLNHLNGWQRLWLVIAACFVTYGAIVKPLTVCSEGRLSSFDYRRSLERDLQNPDCRAYQTGELSKLREPANHEGGGCWHLYTSRRYDETNSVPYTLEVHDKASSRNHTDCLMLVSLIFGVMALILAAILYGAGAIFAWIRRGFRA